MCPQCAFATMGTSSILGCIRKNFTSKSRKIKLPLFQHWWGHICCTVSRPGLTGTQWSRSSTVSQDDWGTRASAIWQEQWSHTEIQKILPKQKRTITVRMTEHWNQLPKEAVGLCSWRHSKLVWKCPKQSTSVGLALSRDVKLGRGPEVPSNLSLPTSTTGYVKIYFQQT